MTSSPVRPLLLLSLLLSLGCDKLCPDEPPPPSMDCTKGGPPGRRACLVADVAPGKPNSNPNQLTEVGGTLFFVATDAEHGTELWKSDGTSEGTRLVADLVPGPASSYPGSLVRLGDVLLFVAVASGDERNRLWRSDGTPEGTFRIQDYEQGEFARYYAAHDVMVVDGLAFFSTTLVAGPESGSGSSLWRSDGTREGTFSISTDGLYPVLGPRSALGGQLYFILGGTFWRSDGTTEGTVIVREFGPPRTTSIRFMTVLDGMLYLIVGHSGLNSTDPGSHELWRSDGTPEGTVRVVASLPTPDSFLVAVGGQLLFVAGDDAHGRELWRSDGTPEGTFLVRDIHPGPPGLPPSQPTAVGDVLFFTTFEPEGGQELWRSDGTPEGTYRVEDIHPGPEGSSPNALTEVDGKIFFSASEPDSGEELWASDGTPEGTERIEDLASGPDSSSPRGFTRVGERIFFVANQPMSGTELWAITPRAR